MPDDLPPSFNSGLHRQLQAPDTHREFFLVVREALLMVVGWIERRYKLKRKRCGCS